MSAEKTNDRLEYGRRVHAEMLDSFDEELEMEIDDDRSRCRIARITRTTCATRSPRKCSYLQPTDVGT